MDRMNRETVLCADTDRLGGRGFSIGHDDRGVHILSGKSGRRDRYAVVVVAQDRTVLGLTPYGQAVLRVETEQSDRRQRFLSCLGHRGRIEKGAGGVRFIGKRYGDLFLSRNRRIHFVRFLAARGKYPSAGMVVIQLFIGYALNGFILKSFDAAAREQMYHCFSCDLTYSLSGIHCFFTDKFHLFDS